MASYQYIYVMKGLNKTFPGGKQVLKDIWLSFLPGAKIGVLGLNGAGKSTLLKIMAGEDDSFTGEAWAADDVKVGYLKQEPHLEREEGRARQRHGGRRRNGRQPRPLRGGVERLLRPRRRHGQADRRAGRAAGEDRRRQRLGPRPHGRDRDGRAALPAVGLPGRQAVGRREAPGGALPPAAQQARHAAARRADQPSRRRIGGLAGAPSRRVPRHRRGGHPRSLLPRQCRRLDPRARPRRRHPVGGQLLLVAGAEGQAPRARGEDRRRPPPHHAARARMDGHQPLGAARQEQGAHRGLRADGRGGQSADARQGADRDPGRPAPRRPRDRGRQDLQGLRRPAADRQPLLQAAAGRHRRRDRPQRRRQDDAVQDDHRRRTSPTRAPSRSGRRSSSAMSTRAARRSIPTRRCGRRSRAASTSSSSATARSPAAPIAARSTSRAPTSRRRSASSRAASATASTSPRC